MFAGNQVMAAQLGIQPTAAYNVHTDHNFAPLICNLTVMCNDFSGVEQDIILDQGNFPLFNSINELHTPTIAREVPTKIDLALLGGFSAMNTSQNEAKLAYV